MYRTVALIALEDGVPLDDAGALGALAQRLDLDLDGTTVRVDGRDVTQRIRDRDVTDAVSRVSAHPEVRTALVEQQRAIGSRKRVVVEGRDIGSTVFPQAEVKVFLTASLDERARRRCEDLGLPCDPETIQRVKVSIEERDVADSQRSSSPLRKPDGAHDLDTTTMTSDEVVQAIVEFVRRRG